MSQHLIKMCQDVAACAKYTAERLSKPHGDTFNVFEDWKATKIILKFLYGQEHLNRHELQLRNRFVSKYQKILSNKINSV
jgi:hypothetical protein